jgi:endonuclease-3
VSLGDGVTELGLDHGEIVASCGQTEGPTKRSDERSGDFDGHGRVGASIVGLMAMRVSSAAMARPRTPAGRARRTHERLAVEYPEAVCELDHADAFQLLTATILSAQATDVGVNKATPGLFAAYPTAEALAAADPEGDIEPLINTIGLFRGKAKNIVGMARLLLERHGGEVPGSMRELTALPGVGRKTANVVRSVALGLPGLPVDTHVGRLARRLGLTDETDPVKVELELNPMVPAAERGEFSLRLILHGRRICSARNPDCGACVLNDFCPSAGDFG